MSLRPPPTKDTPSRLVLRFVVLIVLIALVGAGIWAMVTDQRIDLTETTSTNEIERSALETSLGISLNVVRTGEGTPVVLLHDVDVAGGVLWDGVAAELGDGVAVTRIDLPGFGLSDRVTEEGQAHTVTVMAELVAELLGDQAGPVTVAGAGLGGEVGAQLAVTHPELVGGLVMIDADFWKESGWDEFLIRVPFFGRPFAFTFQGGGPNAAEAWAPECASGGWCPSLSQAEARELAASLEGTSDSIRAFYRTPPASDVPSKLDEVTAPAVYVWSTGGEVPQESIDQVTEALPTIQMVSIDAWKAQLEDPSAVADAIRSLFPG